MLVLDTSSTNTLYYSASDDRYDGDISNLSNDASSVGDFYSISLYMRDFETEVSAIIYDNISQTEEEVVGYVSKQDRGVLELYLNYSFEENSSYIIEVNSLVGDLLYRGSINTGFDYIDEQPSGIIKY